jgi:hypothetical protein
MEPFSFLQTVLKMLLRSLSLMETVFGYAQNGFPKGGLPGGLCKIRHPLPLIPITYLSFLLRETP